MHGQAISSISFRMTNNRQIGVVKVMQHIFGRQFVKRFAICYQTVVCMCVCLSVCPVLSVMLVYFGQTVKWISMKLGTQVGFGPRHIVLDDDSAPFPLNPNFRPMSIVAKWQDGSRCHLARM